MITDDQIKQAILAALTETFEAMIFTQITPTDIPNFIPPVPEHIKKGMHEPINQDHESIETEPLKPFYYQTTINVEKPTNAIFTMTFPIDLAVNITKNLYGWMEKEDPPENVIQDSLSELINTVTGRVMSILLDEDRTFLLGLPSLEKVETIPIERGIMCCYKITDSHEFFMNVEGELFPE
jgi:CheY-specific phosphatase CheX